MVQKPEEDVASATDTCEQEALRDFDVKIDALLDEAQLGPVPRGAPWPSCPESLRKQKTSASVESAPEK